MGLAEPSGVVLIVFMDPIIVFRVRQLVAILAAAVVTAAALRHVVHVHIGVAPAVIRSEALTTATIVAVLVAVEFLGARMRRSK
jgi:hypothetical protein